MDSITEVENTTDKPAALTDKIDAMILCVMTAVGLFGNLFMILSIMMRRSLRKVVNMFLMHHCFISLVKCVLFIPFIIALMNDESDLKGCELIGGLFVTMVTATVLNIAAMTACEAYRFEDLIQEQNESFLNDNGVTSRKKSSSASESQYISNGSGSYTCVLFGIFMIWLSSIILHLGMTLIGSDAKQFYNYKIRNCFLVIGDKQTYILYIMWIMLTVVSLVLTMIYVKRIYKDVSERKFQDKANFFITSPKFYEQKQLLRHINYADDTLRSQGKLNKKNKFSQSYDSLNEKLSAAQNYSLNLKNDCFYLSTLPKKGSNNTNNKHKPNRSALFPSRSISNLHTMQQQQQPLSSSPILSVASDKNLSRHQPIQQPLAAPTPKRRFNFVKLILQRIRIQSLVIKLFIICWLPLFLTVAIDIQFKVSTSVYRYLILLAFSNSSLTPYCYLTILIPRINKYCLPCLRTDGKQSKEKTLYYNEMERYYDKLGDRMHNLSGGSSLRSVHQFQVNKHANDVELDIQSDAYESDGLWEPKPYNKGTKSIHKQASRDNSLPYDTSILRPVNKGYKTNTSLLKNQQYSMDSSNGKANYDRRRRFNLFEAP